MLDWLLPYQFSWLAVTVLPLAGYLYARGVRRERRIGCHVGLWRPLAFFTGLLLCYVVLHTRFDYLGQYLFFMHRAQHLVLHHLGALLIALGNPLRFWRAGLGNQPAILGALGRMLSPLVRWLQHAVMGSVVFVGLIFLWLAPEIHFDAMLSHQLYLLMNWSMLVDGVLFWMVLVDPRPPAEAGTLRYGTRIAMIVATMIPQIALGAYITFSSTILYDVYSVCGRAWPISPQTDQTLGGLLTWIPPAMMEVVAALIVLSMLMRAEREKDRSTVMEQA